MIVIFMILMSMMTTCNSCRVVNEQKAMRTEVNSKIDSVVKLTLKAEEQKKKDNADIKLSIKETMLDYLMYSSDVTSVKTNIGKMREDLERWKKNQVKDAKEIK